MKNGKVNNKREVGPGNVDVLIRLKIFKSSPCGHGHGRGEREREGGRGREGEERGRQRERKGEGEREDERNRAGNMYGKIPHIIYEYWSHHFRDRPKVFF